MTTMTTINESATQSNVTVETKRGGSSYYKTRVSSGDAPVNGLEMYYEIHGTATARPWRPPQQKIRKAGIKEPD